MSDLRKSLEQFRAAYVESSKNGLNIISMGVDAESSKNGLNDDTSEEFLVPFDVDWWGNTDDLPKPQVDL